jgi:hypothetical protein
LTAQYSVATPVNWKDGEDVIIVPRLSDEAAKAKFPRRLEDHQALPPCRRQQPNKQAKAAEG